MGWKPSLFFSTLESAPWSYEVIGIVSVNGSLRNNALKDFEKEAKKMGADGVIGIRFFSTPTYGTGGTTTGYGTAVKNIQGR